MRTLILRRMRVLGRGSFAAFRYLHVRSVAESLFSRPRSPSTKPKARDLAFASGGGWARLAE